MGNLKAGSSQVLNLDLPPVKGDWNSWFQSSGEEIFVGGVNGRCLPRHQYNKNGHRRLLGAESQGEKGVGQVLPENNLTDAYDISWELCKHKGLELQAALLTQRILPAFKRLQVSTFDYFFKILLTNDNETKELGNHYASFIISNMQFLLLLHYTWKEKWMVRLKKKIGTM